ncbi:hypothetical protein T439DRAFT_367376 [Meredithblackwellia eburnea MCA 4105]
MTSKKYIIDEPLLDLNMTLGEGCVWDSRSKRLFFVDIDEGRVYVYDPKSNKYGYSQYDKKVTSIALLEEQDGLIASFEDTYAYIPPSSLPVPILHSIQPPDEQESVIGSARKPYQPIVVDNVVMTAGEKRLNEGAVDPAGRFLAGTMGMHLGTKDGRMFSLRQEAKGQFEAPVVLQGITCTNGMAWIEGGRKMIFTDSWVKEIVTFDYDLAKGSMSNRKVFSNTQEYGYPDGLCVDSTGAVWSARWESGKVVRLDPETAEVTVEITLPTAWNATCCIFGAGETLEDLYITTARCDIDGANPPDRTELGKLYVLKKTGYKGVERNRFKGVF